MFASMLATLDYFSSDPLTHFILRELIWLLSQPLFWAALGVVIGPVLFFKGFGALQRKRLIMNIPRSTIRAAAIGPVEVSGKAAGPYTLVSPLGKKECLYYRVVVTATGQATSAYKDNWNQDAAALVFLVGLARQIFRKKTGQLIDEVCAPLFIDDGTGELMIFPKRAETELTAYSGGDGEYLRKVLTRHGFAKSDLQAAEEFCILPGDDIFVIGTLSENPWAKRKTNSEDDELAPVGPGFVSPDEAALLREEAAAYYIPTLPATSERSYELYPPTIIRKGDCPFIISNRSQREVVARLGWKSLLFIWGAPIWTLWAVWELLGDPRVMALLGQSR
jgi:hypothetical protein